MKKVLLFALAAVALVACNKKDEPTKEELKLSQTSLTLKVGETAQLTANLTVDSWVSSNSDVATVSDGLVTAVAEGNAVIAATAGDVTKTCVVLVTKGSSDDPSGNEIKASQIWPILMDQVTYDANASKMVADFRVDESTNFLYIWASGETYTAAEATGKNFFGNDQGYVALTVAAPAQWSGLGFCLTPSGPACQKAEELRKAIVANPDKYFLHLAMKATDNGYHQFYTFDNKSTSFAIGTQTVEQGAVFGDFTRDGAWHEFDVPMSQFASALTTPLNTTANVNILAVLSGNQPGKQLNLDAIYFYTK